MSAQKTVRNYVNGQWSDPENNGYIDVENPSTGEVIAQTPLSTTEETNRAIEAAHQAFATWRHEPVSRRVQPIYHLVELVRKHEQELTRLITEEMGKSIPDANAEIKRVFENCEVACGMPVLQQGDKLIGAADDIDGEVLRLPMGVFAMIAPFNFPLMVPFWFFPYAMATGNTYVVKPSEQVPLTMQTGGRADRRDRLSAGRVQRGARRQDGGRALDGAPEGQGRLVRRRPRRPAGSSPSECAETNKRFQALGGCQEPPGGHARRQDGTDDPQHDHLLLRLRGPTLHGLVGDRGGGRRRRTSRSASDSSRPSKNVVVANPLDPAVADEPMVMGPVISAKARQFILEMIRTGRSTKGATLALDGRDLTVPGCEKGHFVGPTVFTDVKPGMKIHQTEIFGPVVVILKADSLDEAIRIINDHQYGNGASIYTQNGYYARQFKLETESGMIGVNVGIPAPVASCPSAA